MPNVGGRSVTPNFRKIFSITVALCFTSLTIGGAATLNKSQDNRKKEIVAHTTLTTKKRGMAVEKSVDIPFNFVL